ncbi:MAG TPA: BRCT domain-containing protein [Gammaproteobacteria bacterium]
MKNSFARRAATDARLLARSCEGLLGICAGFLADDHLSVEEIRFLDVWLKDHSELADTFPGNIITARVKEVVKDGKITEEERGHLEQILKDLLGGTLQQTGATSGMSTKLPLEDGIEVVIPNKYFCFTGQFLFGTRAACERAVNSRGGVAISGIRKDLNYLVIGAMASHEWAHTSFGRKIEKAMEYKTLGCPIYIVSEDTWVQSV